MKGSVSVLLACLCLMVASSGCSSSVETQPPSPAAGENPQASTPSAALEPTASPTQEILYTPTLRYTPDSQMETQLQGAEDLVLTHGSIFQFSPSASPMPARGTIWLSPLIGLPVVCSALPCSVHQNRPAEKSTGLSSSICGTGCGRGFFLTSTAEFGVWTSWRVGL